MNANEPVDPVPAALSALPTASKDRSLGTFAKHMRLSCLIFVLVSTAQADPWVLTKGGLSPDKRLAVAVYPQTTENVDGTVLLVDAIKKKIIGPLEEVDSTGGSWGKTTENVDCVWSADSRLLAVNFRAGRMMRSYQLYRIAGRRAVPINLPDPRSHPKGKILDVLGYNANPGAELDLQPNGYIIEKRWGFMPKEGHWNEDYSKFGIKNFERIEEGLFFVYKIDNDKGVKIVDVITKIEKK